MRRAENGTRTRDPNLGKVVLYQLSYFRLYSFGIQSAFLAYARIPPSLKGISLDCGCKGNAFFGIDKLFSRFFNKKIAIILFRPLEKAVTPYYILFLK